MRTSARKGRLISAADKDARAAVFMLERVKGKSLEQIANDYSCAPRTVANYLTHARTHDVLVHHARALLGENLIPLALATYEVQLGEGNLSAARDVLFGTGVLAKTSQVTHESQDELTTIRSSLTTEKIEDKSSPSVPSHVARMHAPPDAPTD